MNDDTGDSKSPKPHYIGHRARLREKFLNAGPSSLADYEILEIILGFAIPRIDVKEYAKTLIKQYGGFSRLLDTPYEKLKKDVGISPNVAFIISFFREVHRRYAVDRVNKKPIIESADDEYDLVKPILTGHDKEEFWALLLDSAGRVLDLKRLGQGIVNQSTVYPRDIIAYCIQLNATAAIFLHNHPADNLSPSAADICFTQKQARLLAEIGVVLQDHIIVGMDDFYSFKKEGRL